MTFINTNGMAFIGPGSEWFWSAVSGLILVITFVAIYRQLRIAGSASAYEQLIAFQNEVWSERMVRVELDLLVALRAGTNPPNVPPGVADILGGFWQQTGALARNGHLDPKLLGTGALGGVTFWWSALAPWVQRMRAERAMPGFMGDFEWLAALVTSDQGPSTPGWEDAQFRDEVLALLEDRLRIEGALRTATVVSADRPPSASSLVRPRRRPAVADESTRRGK
jgi:hypothetical protein